MKDARHDVSADGPDAPTRRTKPGRRVLIVDDSPAIRDMLSRYLAEGGHDAEEADHGLRAIELVITRPFDVVLMDGRMPNMDGFQATGIIRKMSPPWRNIPIIGITAYATPDEHHKFVAAGMNNVIAKPVDKKTLMRAIAEVTAAIEHGPGGADRQPDCSARSDE